MVQRDEKGTTSFCCSDEIDDAVLVGVSPPKGWSMPDNRHTP